MHIVPNRIPKRGKNAEKNLNHENLVNFPVHLSFQGAFLVYSLDLVHHDLGLMACVENQAINSLRVSQLAASQNNVIETARNLLNVERVKVSFIKFFAQFVEVLFFVFFDDFYYV